MRRIPDLPDKSPFQNRSTDEPSTEITPTPVMTTRGRDVDEDEELELILLVSPGFEN